MSIVRNLIDNGRPEPGGRSSVLGVFYLCISILLCSALSSTAFAAPEPIQEPKSTPVAGAEAAKSTPKKQDAEERESAQPDATEQAIPLGIANLVPTLEAERQELEREVESAGPQEIKGFEDRLSGIKKTSEKDSAKARELEKVEDQELSFEELAELQRSAKAHRKEAQELQEEVSSIIETRTSAVEQFLTRRKVWESTLESDEYESVPESIRTRVIELIFAYESGEEVLSARTSKLLALQSEVAELDGVIREFQESLVSRRQILQSQLLARANLRLYQAEFWKEAIGQAFRVDFGAILKLESSAAEYFKLNQDKVVLHLFITLVGAYLLLSLRQAAFVKETFPLLKSVPYDIILISFLLLSFFFYRDAPFQVTRVVEILLIPPLMLFFAQAFEGRFGGFVVGLGIFFFFDALRGTLPRNAYVAQVIFLLELFGAALFSRLLHLHCEQRMDNEIAGESIRHHYFLRLISWYGNLCSFAFLVLIVPLIFGYVRVALYLGESLLGSVYYAVVFFAVFRMMTGVTASLLLTPWFQRLKSISANQEQLSFRLSQVVGLVLLFVWGKRVLGPSGLNVSLPVEPSSLDYTVQVGTFSLSTRGFFFSSLVVFFGFWIMQILRHVLKEDVYERYSWDQGLQSTVDTVVRYLAWLLIVTLALSVMGLGFQNFALIAGALSLGAGLGLQTLVNNLAGGLVLLAERPIKVGDMVSVIGNEGTSIFGNITRVGMRSTTVKTLDHAEIIIPNADLVNQRVTNWTHTNPRARLSTYIQVPYGSDIERIQQQLREGILEEEYVLTFPEPSVLVSELAESGITLEVRGWIRDVRQRPELLSRLTAKSLALVESCGVSVPFPHRVLVQASTAATQRDSAAKDDEESAKSESPVELEDDTR